MCTGHIRWLVNCFIIIFHSLKNIVINCMLINLSYCSISNYGTLMPTPGSIDIYFNTTVMVIECWTAVTKNTCIYMSILFFMFATCSLLPHADTCRCVYTLCNKDGLYLYYTIQWFHQSTGCPFFKVADVFLSSLYGSKSLPSESFFLEWTPWPQA